MQVQKVSMQNSLSFGGKFELSAETIKSIEATTGLTHKEMTTLSLSETEKLMHERGKLKKPNKLKTWLADKYRKIGESLGLLKKEYNIYTDID